MLCTVSTCLNELRLIRYRPSEIVVTENGISMKGENDMPLAQALEDTQRVNFYRDYIAAATDAVKYDKASSSHLYYPCISKLHA